MTIDQASRLRALMGSEDDATGHSVAPADWRVGFETIEARPMARAIAICSGKGGVGKTNLAVNLAARLAARGRRVLVLDADLGTANADVICGVTPRATLEDVVRGQCDLEDVRTPCPGGFELLAGASGVPRLADLDDDGRRRLGEGLRDVARAFDDVLIDIGAGVAERTLFFASLADRVCVLSAPEPASMADAYAAIKVLHRVADTNDLGLVVSMAQDQADVDRVHERLDLVSRRFLKRPIQLVGAVPFDPALRRALRHRRLVTLTAPAAPSSVAIDDIARRILASPACPVEKGGERREEPHRSGLLNRLQRWLGPKSAHRAPIPL